MRAMTANDVGNLVRDRRRERGLSQEALAAQLNVSRKWVVDLERGHPRAELELTFRILGALGLAIDIRPVEQPDSAEPDGDDRARAAYVDLDDVLRDVRADGP